MPQALDLQGKPVHDKPKGKVFAKLYSSSGQIVVLPLIEELLDMTKELWKRSLSIQATSQHVENIYRAQPDNCQFLFTHPIPSSMVAEEMLGKNSSRAYSTPTENEG